MRWNAAVFGLVESGGTDACHEFLEEKICLGRRWAILAGGQFGLAHTVLAQRMVQVTGLHETLYQQAVRGFECGLHPQRLSRTCNGQGMMPQGPVVPG